MFTIRSKITGLEYAPNQCVFIKNQRQAVLYCLNGAVLRDMTIDRQDQKFVYVFTVEDTKELYRKWVLHELE